MDHARGVPDRPSAVEYAVAGRLFYGLAACAAVMCLTWILPGLGVLLPGNVGMLRSALRGLGPSSGPLTVAFAYCLVSGLLLATQALLCARLAELSLGREWAAASRSTLNASVAAFAGVTVTFLTLTVIAAVAFTCVFLLLLLLLVIAALGFVVGVIVAVRGLIEMCSLVAQHCRSGRLARLACLPGTLGTIFCVSVLVCPGALLLMAITGDAGGGSEIVILLALGYAVVATLAAASFASLAVVLFRTGRTLAREGAGIESP